MPLSEIDLRIKQLNNRFAIMSLGENRRVAEFAKDGKEIVGFWTFDGFKDLLIKEAVFVEEAGRNGTVIRKRVPLAPAWLESPIGRSYNRLVYAMPGSSVVAGDEDYNGWHGFNVEPEPGDWSLNRAHVRDVICDGDDRVFQWVLNWCAALVQKPGKHAHTALVLMGGQGTGKGHFVDKMLGALFHRQQYIQLTDGSQLTSEFNEHLSGKVLVFADESAWGGDKKAMNKLKGLVTENHLVIHRKYLARVTEPSALHIVIASNDEWPVRVEHDDRRYCILRVNEGKKQDRNYFNLLHAELNAGGLAAMLHDLLQMEVDWDALRHPPDTSEKATLKERSLSFVERWIQDFFNSLSVDSFAEKMAKEWVYNQYKDAHRRERSSDPLLSENVFGKTFVGTFRRGWERERDWLNVTTGETECPWPKEGKMPADKDGKRLPAYVFPPLQYCRRLFSLATGTRTQWADGNPLLLDPTYAQTDEEAA